MSVCHRPRNRWRFRGGHTLVELLVSMTAATFLMGGLGSCLMIATRAFDGNFNAITRSRAAEVQEDLMVDLSQATSFVTRAADSVSVRVPNRDNDGAAETLTYTWTGLPTAELRYAKNGSTPVTVLRDVQDFKLSYLDRLLPGGTLPPLEPNEWGTRWGASTFGYDTVYDRAAEKADRTAAIRTTLNRTLTLTSISAYFSPVEAGRHTRVRMAIYDVDGSNKPRNLLASTDRFEVGSSGWVTLNTPQILLSPGEYYLALSSHDTNKLASRYEFGGGEVYLQDHDAADKGFHDSWGNADPSTSAVVSIYATGEPN